MEIAFLGATGTVTGSKYLVRAGSRKILVDCGLFQGYKQLRLRNRAPLSVNPADIDAVVLTHAHLDHSGYLPLLVKNGFAGKVCCSEATRDLCAILLPDSGHLQEEEAEYANRHKFSRHAPALPLYTREDAERSLTRFAPVDFARDVDLGGGLALHLLPAGHMLGSSFVRLRYEGKTLLFTGDLGRPNDLIMVAPTVVDRADYLVVESTYGDRRHDPADPRQRLAEVINRTAARGGAVIVPAFAVGRAQSLMYLIHLLKAARAIPDLPVFLNSPMAVNATRIYHNRRGEHRLTPAQCDAMCAAARIVNSVEESKALNLRKGPMLVISASGMATGGRVIHHLKTFAPDPNNTILFVGFQAGGTRGAAMLNGAETIKIHGEYVPVRAEVASIDNLSAHADYAEILAWLEHFESPPRQTFVTHGEPKAADALRHRIEENLGWRTCVPEYLETVLLESARPAAHGTRGAS
ncbi:MAG: mRNA 3'-end processing factor [Candidatus Muproteobacteria bacterium RIFCSPHIGHO2_12_FULL_60_33]|uniref:mRNA 3'-end processing factor n=1 Tax=Candidatus Muproteobacteria bacterium RIFCSPLOWO2_01_FULL_60_18 TaxID=1817768 RepID=A0A1F6U278_9PROT|nr:MAG: mRNA 3'-end processing factor [Candidatus Muproteobacteria bacterium RIFCSPLOWO2_01_FULL_60_18]OGI53370.1 MAG: mRNA 3'-end processing factor [Candidatus Muproteobacteria bacterium RIFCSPHIGHO2_12_FULL_60_33]OGI60431.1 MAG: mRNA 3'-end processing factor [Candidatus Muproteobacteria bacterium RIFCSPHIGHO2_01_FULL_61_200]